MAVKASLVSIPTLVESPFIIASIGGYTFGSYAGKNSPNAYGSAVKVTYPNFMESMQITKVNGTVNTYILNFSYQVRAGEDPNLLDKIFSTATNDRQIILQYGDWNSPGYIYKEEKCIITNITSNLDMNSSCIKYTLNCTSDAIGLASLSCNFPARFAKPSDVLKEMLRSRRYGLKEVFTGMPQRDISSLIASNDKKVQLRAQNGVTPLAYMNYLVNSMVSYNNTQVTPIQSSGYYLTIHDDWSTDYGGTYFKVTEVCANASTKATMDTYELDVNYPDDNFVSQFSLNNDQSWAILYEYSQKIGAEEYIYRIDDNGHVTTEYVPSLMKSDNNTFSNARSSWWTKMTQFPVQATLTIKGLTRPSILMTYVKLNVWFAGGQKHISSGLYIITKQVDSISAAGYKTTLTLLRVGGDS